MDTSNANLDKFANFDVIQTAYKKVQDYEIRADFVIPKSKFTGKRPVIVRFHGGGLITGDSLMKEWFPTWLLELAAKHNAVIATPNHRLLPESSSTEIYEDVEDYWTWLHSSTVADLLSSSVNPTELDFARVITAGESAGGLLSISLALSHPDEIRAATGSYPAIDMASVHFGGPSPPPLEPPLPATLVRDHESKIQPGDVVSTGLSLERFQLMIAAIHFGDLTGLYERGTKGQPRGRFYPIEKLDEPGVKLPRGGISIMHGGQDTFVPVDGVEKFVQKARAVARAQTAESKIILTVRDGMHGFDLETPLNEQWLSDHLAVSVKAWLE
ncbi:uncharacterized protein LDX57_001183 [Aspergillus melleus]|uniref:uncharacterized protein n=1 Tax=Aspergillus melleus TaxID=138277 RepID=UPI001E8E1AAB|nr:uncharacterized protein LDX57_001183 [Aspergillus melleus]KAH8423422.1 hypothetical protein LDX57_001183 [Aspergillus melleus]